MSASATPQAVRLADYRPPDWLIDKTELSFTLEATATLVRARLEVRRNPARAAEGPAPFHLDGGGLTLLAASIDGAALADGDFKRDAEGLTVAADRLPGDAFIWECQTRLDPSANTSLVGLYMSRDMFCTQCEAQGFRKITYYPDRPDVMSVFTTRIDADKQAFPVLLSNGNPIAARDLPDGRHQAEWHDPHPKPSYLFALVAGDLVASRDRFTTRSGRDVELVLYTRPGDEDKTDYAIDSLKRSMAWDETAYGFEYDLDLFMIVAVDDFNMGAMENKGLNIFNSKYILASPETATDRDYELIESIVAHEYFHNWTGNRITCRDWFQLCLKEGLTVFRDQQFSADQRSAPVVRIDHVNALRSRQFREDAGPLAHPVRPDSYVEINNFYTATVYEKGAEIIRMLQTMLGPETYRKAIDLYVQRHDGEACTIEDFVASFEAASGRDLTQFALWWRQAGTPRLTIEQRFDEAAGALDLTVRQQTPLTPGQADKQPLAMPLALGFLDRNGVELAPTPPNSARRTETGYLLDLDAAEQRFRFEGFTAAPVLSLNRDFAAPVIIERPLTPAERALLLGHDSDPFNRWEAGRSLALDAVIGVVDDTIDGRQPADCDALIEPLGAALVDDALDPAFRALLLALPGEDVLAGEWVSREAAGRRRPADPDAIHAAVVHVLLQIGARLRQPLLRLHAEMATPGAYRPTAADAGRRALKNAAMMVLAQQGEPELLALAERQFEKADNMTDQMPALTALTHVGAPAAEAALRRFFERWSNDTLVLGKWLGVQATAPHETTLERIDALTGHAAFEWKNPNKFRALIGAFAMGNPVNFHRLDGAGYRFVTNWLIRLDPLNPQTTAKLVSAFDAWRRYDERRQGMIKAELNRFRAIDGLSKDTAEMIDRILAA